MPRFTRFGNIWRLLGPALVLVILTAVACGEAAAPTSPPPAAQATEAPQAAAQATEAPQAVTQPTAVPEAMAEPEEAMMEVNPGKLTIMAGELGAERFDIIFTPGAPGGLNYVRITGGYLISDNEKREMVPGIASRWAVSGDGLTWTFTIRKGVKFHDGSEVTPEDVLWTLLHYFGPEANDYLISPSRYSTHSAGIELSGPNEVSLRTTRPFVEIALELSEAAPRWYQIMPQRAELADEQAAVDYDNNGAAPR